MNALVRIAVAGAATLLAFAANAQTYPARTVTIMVPFGPGSATDTVTRVVALKLGEALKQSVRVRDAAGRQWCDCGACTSRAPRRTATRC